MSTTLEEKTRDRKANARHRDIVLACIEERLHVLDESMSASIPNGTGSEHVGRIWELLDELKRSLARLEQR